MDNYNRMVTIALMFKGFLNLKFAFL